MCRVAWLREWSHKRHERQAYSRLQWMMVLSGKRMMAHHYPRQTLIQLVI